MRRRKSILNLSIFVLHTFNSVLNQRLMKVRIPMLSQRPTLRTRKYSYEKLAAASDHDYLCKGYSEGHCVNERCFWPQHGPPYRSPTIAALEERLYRSFQKQELSPERGLKNARARPIARNSNLTATKNTLDLLLSFVRLVNTHPYRHYMQ